MRPITLTHYFQDYNDDDVADGDIGVETITETYTCTTVRDLIETMIDVVTTGDSEHFPESSDGGNTLYYHTRWPDGFRTGDPQYRSGSLHLPATTHPLVRAAVIKSLHVYVA